MAFESGDVIYVGNNGAYCGYLEHNGTNFSGTINPTSEDDYLHFYFMGNKGTTSQPTSVSISDQTSSYPVISYAHSTTLYKSGVTSYTAKLQNYCSIVKFTTNSIPTATAVTVKGMKNTVAVNFGANNAATSTSGSPYTFNKSGDGDIILHAVSETVRWAILLEQDKVDGATVTASGYSNSTCNVPAIENNTYYSTGVSVNLTAPTIVTWNYSQMSSNSQTLTQDGVTLSYSGGYADLGNGSLPYGVDYYTFTNSHGKKFKSIVITAQQISISSDGWRTGGDAYGNGTSTWTGDASSVSFSGYGNEITTIVFTLE